jgi:hypothetical protein
MNLIGLAQDGDKWWNIVKTVIKLSVSIIFSEILE